MLEKFRANILKFIKNLWREPGELFDFPSPVECSNSNRHFVWSWLKRFAWLAYSKYLVGAFCLPCAFFGVQCGRNTKKLDKLLKSPLTLLTSAISRACFTKHASGKCEMHNLAVIANGESRQHISYIFNGSTKS